MGNEADRMKQRVSGTPAVLAVLLGVVVGVLLGLFFEPQGLAHESLKDRPVFSKEGLQRLLDKINGRILR